MSMRCDELKDLMPLLALDLLGSEEEALVRPHLDGGCPRCAAELAAAREALDLLPFGLPPREPSPMVKARLLARVRQEEAARSAAPRPIARARTFAASVAAAILAGVLTAEYATRRADGVIAGLQERIDRQTAKLTALQNQIRATQESIRLVSAPGVLVVELKGQGPQAESSARIFWDRKRDRWELYAANLPSPPAGKTYQLWLITASAKVSAGVFEETAQAASGRVSLPAAAGPVVAAAVTDEPAGGSSQPTGSILLLGKL